MKIRNKKLQNINNYISYIKIKIVNYYSQNNKIIILNNKNSVRRLCEGIECIGND